MGGRGQELVHIRLAIFLNYCLYPSENREGNFVMYNTEETIVSSASRIANSSPSVWPL